MYVCMYIYIYICMRLPIYIYASMPVEEGGGAFLEEEERMRIA